jgi:hypothetical protein
MVRVIAVGTALIAGVLLATVFLVRAEDRVPAGASDAPAGDSADESWSSPLDDQAPAINGTEEMQRRASATIVDDWRLFVGDVPELADEERAKVLQILRDFQRAARAALSTYDGDVRQFFRMDVPELWAEARARAAQVLTPRQLSAFEKRFRTAGTTLAVADRLIGDSLAPRTLGRDAM